MKIDLKCKICGKEFKNGAGLYNHARKMHSLSTKEYYDKYLKKSDEGICKICGKQTEFRKNYYNLTCSKQCSIKYSDLMGRSTKISNTKSYSKFKNNNEFINYCKNIFGNKFDYSLTNFKGLSKNTDFICSIHGKFTATPRSHIRSEWGNCPICGYKHMGETKSNWSPRKKKEVYSKKCQTWIEHYGEEHPFRFGGKRHKKIIKEKYGVDNVFQSEEIKEKIKQTNLERHGVENPGKLPHVIEISHSPEANKKRIETKKKNGTFNTSKAEEEFYEFLLTIFNKSDIEREYNKDARYPYHCDFYIKSLDLFIELNIHPTHNGHNFDKNNNKDIEQLEEFKKKNTKYYDNVIKVWTGLDVKKYNTAIKNKLNYKQVWNYKELEEYKEELKSKYE